MVRNKLAMAVLALSVLQANVAGALGLGNLSVKSALNQPLNAEIKLLDIGDLDAAQIKIQLGSPEDFQRASVERDYFLTNLKFDVDLDGRGGGAVHITTREPVVEPYLNFVIEARWPNGRVLREFAVLLDPPTFNANRATAPVTPAKSGGAAATARPTRSIEPPSVTAEPASAATPKSADLSMPAAEKSGEYRIQAYDTLSKIAAQHKPAGDVSVEQTMLAIQRANPQAFIRNNVNLIKSGYVIRLPSADEARSVAAAQAATEVEEQVREWRGGARTTAPATAATGPQLDARTPEPTDKEGGYKEQARLSIAAPGGSDKSSAGEGAGGSGKGTEALRNQLTASQEMLEKGKRDNKELQSRLDDMERQIATLQRLISLKDDQLAALQAKSGQAGAAQSQPASQAQPQPQPQPATAQAGAAPAPATAPAAAGTTTTETTTTTTTTSAPAPAPAPKPVAPKPATPSATTPRPAAPVAEPSLIEQLTSNPLYLGGAGAVIALLAGLAVLRRRKAAAEEEAMEDFALADHVDFEIDEGSNEAPRIDEAASAVIESSAERVEEPRAPQIQPVRSETGDAIAEADIYIAYGRYQQAVDLLSHAIDAEPARSDLRVKLLEVCLEMRNREAFRQQFVALQGLGDAEAVAHAKDLLSSVDGVSDWLVDLPQAQQRPINEVVASAAVAATAASAAIAAADSEHETTTDWSHRELVSSEETELDLDLDDLGLGDELPAGEHLEVEGSAAGQAVNTELDALNLEDDLNLDEELDLDAPLDLDNLDLDKELSLDDELSLDHEIDLDRKPASEQAPTDDRAEALDLEAHPGLDGEFDLDEEPSAPAAIGEFESELADLSATPESDELLSSEHAEDFDFEIEDIDEDLSPAAQPATAFDLHRTSTELPGGPSPVATPDESIGLEGELALDLEHDPLESTLDEMGETGYLNDLEGVADALHDLDAPAGFDLADGAAPAAPAADLSDEFDLGNLDAELPEIDRLDLGAGTPAETTAAAAPLPDLATDLPPEFDAAAAALDAESAPADEGDEFDFLADADEIATKLDLARAYIDMGDTEGAKDILDEVLQEGTDSQRQEASTLLDRIA